MTASNDPTIRCPSAKCEPGSSLLGIVNREGKIDYLETPFPLNSTFLEAAQQGRTPEKRFRFTASCVESGCQQWLEGRCTVADKVIAALQSEPPAKALPHCGIRASCRWYRQSGKAACSVCEHVVTDTLRD